MVHGEVVVPGATVDGRRVTDAVAQEAAGRLGGLEVVLRSQAVVRIGAVAA